VHRSPGARDVLGPQRPGAMRAKVPERLGLAKRCGPGTSRAPADSRELFCRELFLTFVIACRRLRA
jgi:hypothetical protein